MANFRTKFPSCPSQPPFAKGNAATKIMVTPSVFNMHYGCRLIMNTLKTVIENARTFEVSTIKLVLFRYGKLYDADNESSKQSLRHVKSPIHRRYLSADMC